MNKYNVKRALKGVCVLLALLVFVTACGAGSFNDVQQRYETDTLQRAFAGNSAPMPPAQASPGGNRLTSSQAVQDNHDHREPETPSTERHVIRRATVDMGSGTFDETVTALRAVAPGAGGYIESETLTATGTPRLTIVLRVPVATFDDVMRHIATLADITHQNQWAEDVTDQFYDLTGNLETRRIEEERILELIEGAANINERLALESRLSNVRQTIASYRSRLTQMTNQISYSTITVMLVCTKEPAAAAVMSLGERIGGAFGDSVDGTVRALQGIVVFLAGAVLPLGLAAVIGFVVWRVIKAVKRKAEKLAG
jgi:hypothetical protein